MKLAFVPFSYMQTFYFKDIFSPVFLKSFQTYKKFANIMKEENDNEFPHTLYLQSLSVEYYHICYFSTHTRVFLNSLSWV